MIEEAIIGLKAYNGKMKDAVEDVVRRLRIQETDEALNLIFDYILEGIQWELEMVNNINPVVGDMNVIETTNEALSEIMSAVQNGDYILLADLFEYELKPSLQLIDKVERKA